MLVDKVKRLRKYYGELKAVTSLSEDMDRKVGAIALDSDCNIIATGCNNPPKGVIIKIERIVKPDKLKWMVHAEASLVANAANRGVSLKGSTVLVYGKYPCQTCAGLLIEAGVKEIVATPIKEGSWTESNTIARIMFSEAGVEIVEDDHLE